VGAATGATVGKLFGVGRSCHGGIGIASVGLPGGERVAALVAVNAFGNVVDPEIGRAFAGARGDAGILDAERLLREDPLADSPLAAANTTLVCVAATVPFDTAALKRVAMEAHDGIARAVRPAHTLVDGDAVFAIAPPGGPPPVLTRVRVGAAAAHVTARAIVEAVRAGATAFAP
jgi:L-aminopeptidase/D-esterase-like protein